MSSPQTVPGDWKVDQHLIDRVRHSLQSAVPEQRGAVLNSLAETLVGLGDGPRVLTLLAEAPEPMVRHLTTLVATRLPIPPDASFLPLLRPLLGDRRVPEPALLSLTSVLLRASGGAGPEALDILQALVEGLSKPQAVELLRRLEQHGGKGSAIEEFCARLEDQIQARCPRCPARLPRPLMIKHLWLEHGLLVDGRAVHEPWSLIEDWLEEYARKPEPELLARCRALGVRVDPEHGLSRVQRLILVRGIADAQARTALLADAIRRGATLCPHCYSQVAPAPEAALRPLNVSHGRLSAGGYRVEVSEHGLVPRLEIETPAGIMQSGCEPGRHLTPRGVTVLLAGPLVLLALALAFALRFTKLQPLFPVTLLLSLALAVTAAAHIRMWFRRRPRDRAIDYAWSLLVPRLHAQGFARDDSAWTASLALTSLEHGDPEARTDELLCAIGMTDRAVAEQAAPAAHLGALWCLAAADTARTGIDALPLVLEQLARVFSGQLPPAFLELLLVHSASVGLNDSRLRVLLCDRAFEAGYEVHDLVVLGQAAPALGSLLETDDPGYLSQLRLLWSLRSGLPWSRCGPAATAFELAANPTAAAKHLVKLPDLLLVAWELPDAYLCARGLFFHDVLFTDRPRSLGVKARKAHKGGGFDLMLGEHQFWFASNPDRLVTRLEHWFRFYFQEFRPQVANVQRWRSPETPDKLGAYPVLQCPECQKKLRVRVGEVGMVVES